MSFGSLIKKVTTLLNILMSYNSLIVKATFFC